MPLKISVRELKSAPDFTQVDFSTRLNHCGVDYHVILNLGYEAREGETPILQSILNALINEDTSGVTKVQVTPYTLFIHHSGAVSAQDIIDRIKAAVNRHQVTTVMV